MRKGGGGLPKLMVRLIVVTIVVAMGLLAFGWYLPLIRSNQQIRERIAERERQIRELGGRIAWQKRTLEGLETDPDVISRVIREKLNYGKEGEVIYRFEPVAP